MSYTPPTVQDYERFLNQKAIVLTHLQSGQAVTQDQAKERWGIMRLASRIDELRREGWNIITTMIPAGENGAMVAQYALGSEPRRKSSYLPVVPENIPDELKALPQWVTWRGVRRGEKMTKVPWTVDGLHRAKSDDPSTWGIFEEALKLHEAGQVDGIGFVFAREGGLVGVDLDGCFDESGKLVPQAAAIVKALACYTEYSVSGKGLHVICRASLAKGHRSGPVEIYPSGRYFTVTGHVWGELSEVRPNQAAIDGLVRLISPKKKAAPHAPRIPQYLGNAELIEKARTAKNGEKFARLWSGDISGYASHSEADLALLSLLLYWTNDDEDRASVLFADSGLYREKWERMDYRRRCFDFLKGAVAS